MGFLKGLGTFICSFLLFLALTVFSIAFMLHSTVLNQDFVKSQVDKIEISDIARDIAEKQIGKELPEEAPFLKDVAYEVISEEEPWIKEQLNNAIDTGYDYFLGKSDFLQINVSLVELKQNLSDTMWEATKNYIKKECAGKSDAEVKQIIQDFVAQIPEGILPAELAILPSDVRNTAIEQFIRVTTGLQPIVNLPPAITDVLEIPIKQYIDRYIAEYFIDEIPDSYTIDEGTIGRDTMDSLTTAKKVIGYFQTYYPWLIVFMVVMAGFIFLINRDVRVTARTLGTDLFLFGIFDLAGALVLKSLSLMQYLPDFAQIPASMEGWLDGLAKDVASIAMTFSIGVLVVAVILLVVSFIVKPKKKQLEAGS